VIRKVIRVGDSVAITLPKEYVDRMGLKPGDKVRITLNGFFVIKPVKGGEEE